MTGPAPDVAALVAALLRGLPAADLAALAEGRARLAVVPVEVAPAAPPSGRVAPRTRPAARATSPARQAAPHAPQAAPPAPRAAPAPDPAR
ncbi:hypothetical protein ABT346_07315, partial [Micromonospora peucetia]